MFQALHQYVVQGVKQKPSRAKAEHVWALKKKFKISGVCLAVIAVQYTLLTVFQGQKEDSSYCEPDV